MCEIEYKLKSSNPILVSHGIAKLVTAVELHKHEDEDKISKLQELKLLLSSCASSDSIVSSTAFQALELLVQNGALNSTSILTYLITHLPEIKNYTALVSALNKFLLIDWKSTTSGNQKCIPFALKSPQHPLLTILNVNKNAWKNVFREIDSTLRHRKDLENIEEYVKPLFLYILCNPVQYFSLDCKRQVWDLLLEGNDKPTTTLLLEVLEKLPKTKETIEDSIHLLCRLANRVGSRKDRELAGALMPLLLVLILRVLDLGSDPKELLEVVLELSPLCGDYSCDVAVVILSDVVRLCPSNHLSDIILTASRIIQDNSSCEFANSSLVSSILSWMIYPSVLSTDALENSRDLIRLLADSKPETHPGPDLSENKLFQRISYADENLAFYGTTTRLLRSFSASSSETFQFLKNLSSASLTLKDRCRFLLCGVLLASDVSAVLEECTKILVEVVTERNPSFAGHLLSTMLHKLTRTTSPLVSKTLLFAIPEMAVAKENVPVIVRTVDSLFSTLGSNDTLSLVSVELYLRMWKHEKRCYRYLETALINSCKERYDTWYSDVVHARVLKHICKEQPGNGEDLVPLLSQILNKCTDANGGTASALAIDGISLLCESGVVDILSTWRVLAPKMKLEKRTVVLRSLCGLFQEIPSFPRPSTHNYRVLLEEVHQILWSFVFQWENPEIARSALKALRSLQPGTIPWRTIPEEMQRELRPPVEEVMEIPTCRLLQVLDKVDPEILPEVRQLLVSYVEAEVRSLSSRLYNWTEGEPFNFKYLPETSVLRAAGEFLRNHRGPLDERKEVILTECLRILAFRYSKYLPQVQWSFLERLMGISLETKRLCLSILCRHCDVSVSAKKSVENYLQPWMENPADGRIEEYMKTREYASFYENLTELCASLPTNLFKPFLEASLSYTLEKTSVQVSGESQEEVFQEIMMSYAKTLKDRNTHQAVRTLLTENLEKLFDQLSVDSGLFEIYLLAVEELATVDVERLTNPNLWWEIPLEKLKKAVLVRKRLTMKSHVWSPLNWMKELVDVIAPIPKLHEYLFETIQEILQGLKARERATDWVLSIIANVQKTRQDLSAAKADQTLTFLCDVLFLSMISLSTVDKCLVEPKSVVASQEVRSELLPLSVIFLFGDIVWRDILPQIMEFFYDMRTSTLSKSYRLAFHNSLMTLKNEEPYCSKWNKYLSTTVSFDSR